MNTLLRQPRLGVLALCERVEWSSAQWQIWLHNRLYLAVVAAEYLHTNYSSHAYSYAYAGRYSVLFGSV